MVKTFVYSSSLILLLTQAGLKAQLFTGTIVDKETKQPLAGAHIRAKSNLVAMVSDANGKFESSRLNSGSYHFIASFIGYQPDTIQLDLFDKDIVYLEIELRRSAVLSDEYVVQAITPQDNSTIVHHTIDKEQLQKQNLGQDLPFLVNWSPSIVTTSDAGAGIGYTGMRIRGSDQTRINVTINGIPLNDAESQGVFWVNTPDLAASTDQIDIQRGVGTSTNGAGAFGATVNIKTSSFNPKPYGNAAASAGSFNTLRRSLSFGSGLLNNHWAIEGRFSGINSDGYIDRASSQLQSHYLSTSYLQENTLIKFITFSGKERTYQSWYGTPESRLNNDEQAMRNHALNNGYTSAQLENLLESGRTYNYYLYENEVDDYRQDHYQLHLSQKINGPLLFNASLHYTKGAGYFEQYREGDDFSLYGIAPYFNGTDTISSGDFIRRRWLDNDFYGTTFSLIFTKGKSKTTFGGAYNEYIGEHFGELNWAEYAGTSTLGDRFYDNDAVKTDGNVYLKQDVKLRKKLDLFLDFQLRNVNYATRGIDIDNRRIAVDTTYLFFNPKMGINYSLSSKEAMYVFVGVGNREPMRNDFIDAISGQAPKHETLIDFEAGYKFKTAKRFLNVNLYQMNYQNQLVLTGELNDVGTSIRTNASQSYRRGIELEFGALVWEKLSWQFNTTYSQNKIASFEEVLYDYSDTDVDVLRKEYSNTDISFSPSLIAGSSLGYELFKDLEFTLLTKYVGEQFLDNTSNDSRKLDAYLQNDLRIIYGIPSKQFSSLTLSLLINNLTNSLFSSNGYTFSYIAGEQVTENFFYPQAGRNFLIGLTIGF